MKEPNSPNGRSAQREMLADMVLSIGYVEGKLDTLAAFSDGKAKQELLNAKSFLANMADDLISAIEEDESTDASA